MTNASTTTSEPQPYEADQQPDNHTQESETQSAAHPLEQEAPGQEETPNEAPEPREEQEQEGKVEREQGPADRAARHQSRMIWRWEEIERFFESSRTAVHNYLVDLRRLDLYTERAAFLQMEAEMTEGLIDATTACLRMHAGLLDRPMEAPSKILLQDKRIILPGQG